MSEPIKLKLAGEKATIDVVRCRLLPFGNDPEIEYEGRDGSKVWVPKPSSDRQLARLNLTMETVVGRRVTIKRDANSAKGRPAFWGIYLEDGNGSGAGAAKQNGSGGPVNAGAAGVGRVAQLSASSAGNHQAPATAPAPQSEKQEQGASGYRLYRQITEKVLDDLVPMYVSYGVKPDAQAIAAISATLFIQASRH